MSDRTISCNEECLYADEYLVTPVNCCLGVHQAETTSFICNVLPEIVFNFFPNEGAKEKKGKMYTMIKDFLALFRDILLPRPQDNADYGPNDYDSSPAVIFRSYGGSIQPMIWNPENQNRKGDR
jgi:hypothetical protein